MTLSKNLLDKIKYEVASKKMPSFNLNFKIEGEQSNKFDIIAKKLKRSRTELAKFIILESIDEILDELKYVDIEINNSISPNILDEKIILLTNTKLLDFKLNEEFELSELFDTDWQIFGEHGDKNRVGKRFKKLIKAGEIKNIEFSRKKTNNHALYKKIRNEDGKLG